MRNLNKKVDGGFVLMWHRLVASVVALLLSSMLGCTVQFSDDILEPNFIIIFTDDQGYGDLGCFGGKHVCTPHLDRMAAEGSKLTSFYVAAPICTPSRAALMTGCYPKRIGMASRVLLAADERGLHPDEITIAEVLKSKGYSTGVVGKWHLGDQPEFLPTEQGFDEFFGLPYSHDIHPWHPNNAKYNFPDLPLLDGQEVVELNPDMNTLTQRITDRAVAFIKENKDRPFFLYVPHPLPHRPLYVSPTQMEMVSDSIRVSLAEEEDSILYGRRDQLYAEAIGTIDDSVGEIFAALAELGLNQSTLVIFSSDNGPARGGLGSSGRLRGRKGQTYEGGMRMPTLAWWPDKIPQGREIGDVLSTMDLLPTFAHLARAEIPQDRKLDGQNIWPVLAGQENDQYSPRPFCYYKENMLEAVRLGDWKYSERSGERMLHNLREDIGEGNNVIQEFPEVAGELEGYFDTREKELGRGSNLSAQCRSAGLVQNPKPLSLK